MKTNVLVSDLVRHKPGCRAIESENWPCSTVNSKLPEIRIEQPIYMVFERYFLPFEHAFLHLTSVQRFIGKSAHAYAKIRFSHNEAQLYLPSFLVIRG